MLTKMHNVSQLMDCVACEKCRLWGKLESQGIATAIKIIVSNTLRVYSAATQQEPTVAGARPTSSSSEDGGCTERDDSLHFGGHGGGQASKILRLRRSEKVALMNLLRQLTVAVWSAEHNCR
jgi:hypothetical protein